ncbi:Uveal autoantigen with coiled coil domains [Echinococcus multilocularis]|uniref:Uveal autoantigen with coiled coil domains n=1 Tax=Echinococcus multilocularis TaxID=6211 RepID=A0A068Y1L2_ECHMU|nr:Uveal autoantigen with coiled coil domains [Echinococcus multilocularis]
MLFAAHMKGLGVVIALSLLLVMASADPGSFHSSSNFDENVSFVGKNLPTRLIGSPLEGIRTVPDESEEIAKLRRENFKLSLLCYKYEQIYQKGLTDDPAMRITDLENVNSQLVDQSNVKSRLLDSASKMLTSMKNENDQLRADLDGWIKKFESCEGEWRNKYDLLTLEFQELKSSQRRAESRCEIIENESSRLETTKRAEISALQQQLVDAETKIAMLEAELKAFPREAITFSHPGKVPAPRFSDMDDKENDSSTALETLRDPLTSPNITVDQSLRRHNTCRDTIKNLKYECEALNAELTACKQLLVASESKLQLVMDQLEAEKASHAKSLARRNEIEQALHSRISDLVSDRNCQANLNDMLSAQLAQLKEHDERIKREHLRQLETLDRMLQDRERTIYELSTLASGNQREAGDPSSQCLPAPEDTAPLEEVTQLRHNDSSTIFDVTADHQVTGNQSGDLAKLQRELAVLRGRLVAQVKANTRLKTAYNTLSHSMIKAPVDLSQSVNPFIAEETAANASRLSFTAGASCDESSLGLGRGLFNLSNNKASLALDKTVSELQATLSRLEAEISAVEISHCASFSQSENEKATVEASTNAAAATATGAASSQSLERLKSLHSLIKNLLNQFDNMRFIHHSFHETVNRSLMATSMCMEASAQKVVTSVGLEESQNRSLPSSFFCAAGAAEISVILPPDRSYKERDAAKAVTDAPSLNQHDNTTFNLLLQYCRHGPQAEITDDLPDTSTSFSCHSLALSARTGDVSCMEAHNRRIFDRISLAVARIQEAVDEWSVKAATEVLMALTAPENEGTAADGSATTAAPSVPVDEVIGLVTRFVSVVSRAQTLEVAEPSGLLEWRHLAHKWFLLLIDALRKGRKEEFESPALSEIDFQLGLLEHQFNEGFAHLETASADVSAPRYDQPTSTTAVAEAQTPPPPPSVPLKDHEAALSKYAARCEQLASANAALQATYVQVSEELEAAYRKHADSIAAIQAAAATKEVEFAEMEQSLNRAQASAAELEARVVELQTSLAENTERASGLSAELEESLGNLLRLQDKLTASEAQLSEEARAHEMAIEAVTQKYSTLLELAESKLATAEDQCQDLLAHQEELMAEIEAKDVRVVSLEADLESVRMTAAETQVALDTLRRRVMDAEKITTAAATNTTVADDANGELDETMREKARKYPELKAIAFDLKARLGKRAELLESSMKETRRLKRIVMDNERRAKGFLEELERLRQQILMKNAMIKKLETLALSCHANGASAADGGAGPSLPNSAAAVVATKVGKKDNEVNVEAGVRAEDDASPLEDRRGVNDSQSPQFQLHSVEDVAVSCCRMNAGGYGSDADDGRRSVTLFRGRYYAPAAAVSATTSASLMSPSKAYSLPQCVDGVSSLMANIGATVRELSTRLESQHITSIETEGEVGEANQQVLMSVDTSASLMDELTLPSTTTPSSLSVSFPDPTQPFAAIADLQDYLNRCAGQLTSLFAALMQQLESLLTSVQAPNAAGECTSLDHAKARRLIRHSLGHFSPLLNRHPTNTLISHVVETLAQALRLLHHTAAASLTASSSSSRGSNDVRKAASSSPRPVVTATTPTCSCSCRRRCSQMAASVQELTALLTNTANALSRRGSHETMDEVTEVGRGSTTSV